MFLDANEIKRKSAKTIRIVHPQTFRPHKNRQKKTANPGECRTQMAFFHPPWPFGVHCPVSHERYFYDT
jgi:hypothetical protein